MAFLFSIQSESARPSKESSGSTFVNSAILKNLKFIRIYPIQPTSPGCEPEQDYAAASCTE